MPLVSELIALLHLSSWCLVMVERLFLAVPQGCLRFVIVVFPDHTHYIFLYWLNFHANGILVVEVDQESHVLLDFSNCKLNLSFPSTCESLGSLTYRFVCHAADTIF